jgi:hypothetical protein
MQTALEFTNRLLDLHRQERFAMADFIVTLAEFDRRELWRDLGHASLFAYLIRGLKLSGGAASYRKTACELVRRFPLVAASMRPVKDAARRDVVTVVRPTLVAAPPPEAYPSPGPDEEAPLLALRAPEVAVAAPAPTAARVVALPPPREIEPIDSREARVHFNVQLPVLDKVKAAKDALSHSHPGACLPRGGPAGGVPSGGEPMRVAAPLRRALRLDAPARARSRHALGARGSLDARERTGPLRRAQRALRAPRVRRRVDGQAQEAPGRG